MDVSKKNQGPAWKQIVKDHFAEINLSQQGKINLENLLLSSNKSHSLWEKTGLRLKKWGAGYVVTAFAAASLTFVVIDLRKEEPQDAIAELTSQSGSRYYPPDFNLEGDASALKDILTDVFAEQNFFTADIPKNIQAQYSPNEGRFFSWDGEPAVSIQLKSFADLPNSALSPPATLYIVKLSTKSAGRFPKEKLTKHIASKAGKIKKVNVWREGKYGYAMVQSVAINE